MPRMGTYLVEGYEPGLSAPQVRDLVARIQTGAEEVSRTGPGAIVHRLAMYAPEDEVCLHLFDATDRHCIERLAALTDLSVDRITATTVVGERGPSRFSGVPPAAVEPGS